MEMDFANSCPLVRPPLPHIRYSVRRITTLLHASFRRALAEPPLRFTSASPPSGCTGDFHPQAVGHVRHTIGIGGHLAMPPLPHHRAYGSVPRRFGGLSLQQISHG